MIELLTYVSYVIIFCFVIIWIVRLQDKIDKLERDNNELRYKISSKEFR